MSYDYEFDCVVDDIVEEHVNTSEDVDDILRTKLDYYVSCNDYHKNIEIINDIAGDVFEAIKKYKDTYGEINTDCSKPQFYAILTYCVLYDLFQTKVEEKMNEI